MTPCTGCGTALADNAVLYDAQARPVCQACFDKGPAVGSLSGTKFGAGIAGLICGAIPFVASMSTTSMSTSNGEVTSFVYRDWLAVVFGALAIACGAVAILGKRDSKTLGLALAAVALGAFQIARGFGVFASP